jgi:hypothetical protein
MALKQDGSSAGLRIAEETSLGVLPGTPVFYSYEPNTIADFGATLKRVARLPIDPTRQQRKGTIVDQDAAAAFNTDVTPSNLERLLQGFVFADAREKPSSAPLNTASNAITAVTSTTFAAAAGLGSFLVNGLAFASGFGVAANNGVWKLSAVAANLLTTAGLTAEAAPPATAKVRQAGYEFASATLDVTVTAGIPRLNRASGAFDFTTLGLIPGEWIFVGDDTGTHCFANNIGWARILTVAVGYIDLDKTAWTPQAEVGTGKTIRIYFGNVYKNESTVALIKRRSYACELTVGTDANGTMSEVVTGAVPNEMTLTIKGQDKVTADLSFVGMNSTPRDGTAGLIAGTRPTLVSEDAINTTSDFSRIKLAKLDATTSAPTALAGTGIDITLSLKNNVESVKGIAILGGFEASVGSLDVTGKGTFYFTDQTVVTALKANVDATLDIIMARKNQGVVIDLPLIALGSGKRKVERNKPITIDLDKTASAHPVLNHTILFGLFPYTPTAAE